MLVAGANNIVSLVLAREWQGVESIFVPRCESKLDIPAAGLLIRYAQSWDPANNRILLNVGRVAWLNGDCENALVAWEGSVALAPRDPLARLNLASGFLAMGRRDEALFYYDGQYLYSQGRRADADEKIELAIMWYELNMAVRPTLQTVEALVENYERVGRAQEIGQTWIQLADVTSINDSIHWWALGHAAEARGNWEKAQSFYRNGLKAGGDTYDFRWRMAKVAEQSGNLAEAETQYLKARDDRPEEPAPYFSLGHLAHQRRDFEEAISWYNKGGELQPESKRVVYYQGLTYWNWGRLRQAKERFETLLQYDPDHAEGYYYLGLIDYQSGNLSEAIQYLERAVSLREEPLWTWWLTLGDWYIEAERKIDARVAYKQALSLNPSHEGVREKLATLEE